MTFTTANGTMNRHLKTRASTPLQHRRSPSPTAHSCSDSDGGASVDSEHQRGGHLRHQRIGQHEFNNNEILRGSAKRKYQDYLEQQPDAALHVQQQKHKIFARVPQGRMNFSELYSCDHCGSRDFENIEAFEAHVESLHPNGLARCDTCDLGFKNHRELCFHRLTVHMHQTPHNNHASSILGFKDLTFVDFSAGKFPAIARAVCEQSLHRPATDRDISFQCSKCLRGFPCQSALDAHETECGLVVRRSSIESTNHRINFFAGLDLQDKREGKDLADIQSILSVTSGTPLLQNFSARSDPGTPEHCGTSRGTKPGVESSGSSGTPCSSESHEEEAQDPCIEEIRKWKQKGEFPCRLCHQTYPNLRALKGHNRMHTSEDSGVPYPCNVCTYSGTDRATLMKHMKSHSGDRPYECSLCKFGFTTKANCERHVRKRHFKLTREEIKEVMVYNPSEDPTNSAHFETTKDLVRKTLVYPTEASQSLSLVANNEKTVNLMRPAPQWPQRPPPPPSSHIDNDDVESRSSEDSASLVSDAKKEQHPSYQSPVVQIQASPIDLKKLPEPDQDEEAPLDLSMDVLDLSKKSSNRDEEQSSVVPPTTETNEDDYISARNQILLTQALLKSGQVPMPPMYANAPMMYGNFGMPGLLQQYMFNPHLFSAQEFALKERFQKELVRGLQTSGGNLVDGSAPFSPIETSPVVPVSPSIPKIPTTSMPKLATTKLEQPVEQSVAAVTSANPNNGSVKMVIKNGVLMPRQKQRRYRTERPFMCGHCTAKFTLRSNMERHIKQQHPQHWSQRPRGGYSTRGRPPANPPTLIAPQISQVESQPAPVVPDQVKYAILAQKLKGPLKQEEVHNESENEELVIDEPPKVEIKPEEIKVEPEIIPEIKQEPELESAQDLASVSEIIDNTKFQPQYMSDEDAAHASTSDCNPSTDETSDCTPNHNNNTSSTNNNNSNNNSSHFKKKRRTKKSAYSMAPNRVICPYCDRPFPWNSSLRRHVLTHTGQKPFQCKFCNLPFTTKSNRDRHMLRKHKANANKLRQQTRRTSSPELPEIASAANNSNFNMRNVPERPYKCNQCPSSTFSTLGNLKKHRSVKHSVAGDDKYDSAHSSDNQHSPAQKNPNDQSGYESQSSTTSEVAEPNPVPIELTTATPVGNINCNNASSSGNETSSQRGSKKTSPRSSPGPPDAAPFKCHLCDSGFAVRQDCQEHIKSNHKSSYDMLVAKGAMDMSQELIEENIPPIPQPPPQHSSDGEEKRGRFPDYSNRKVVCAFCMRRFWSAEDLRRHMRTHTGERPFFCDICSRRFTLKHSMLRHRKKHGYAGSSMYVGTSGDEEQSSSAATSPSRTGNSGTSATSTAGTTSNNSVPIQPPTATPRTSTQLPQLHQQAAQISGGRASLPQTASVGDAAPSGLSMRYNPYERLVALRRPSPPPLAVNGAGGNNDEDDVNLISNLLGLSNSVVKEAIAAQSPDLAAQMIGAP